MFYDGHGCRHLIRTFYMPWTRQGSNLALTPPLTAGETGGWQQDGLGTVL